MTSLFDVGIAPGRICLPTPEAFEAYWAKCEAAIIEAQVQELAAMPSNDDRAGYFDRRAESIQQIEDPRQQLRRLTAMRRLKRMVWEAIREGR